MKHIHIENNLIGFEDFLKKGNKFLGKQMHSYDNFVQLTVMLMI